MTKEVDGRGVTKTYSRADPDSLVTQVAYTTLPGYVTPLAPVNYTYDDFGRRSGMNDGDGSTTGSYKYTYGYDDLDELRSQTVSFPSGPQNQTLAFAHNNDGSRLSLTIPGAGAVTNPLTVNGGKFSYFYDGVGRLNQANFPWTGRTQNGNTEGQWHYLYQPNSWLTDTYDGLPTSSYAFLHTRYVYNARGFLTSLINSLTDPRSSSLLTTSSTFDSMTYDALGNRLAERAAIPTASSTPLHIPDASRRVTYTYDTTGHSLPSQNRDVLLSETSVYTGIDDGRTHDAYHENYTNTYAYDAAYNDTSYSAAGILYGLTFNFDNQLNNSGLFAFDGAGNPTTYSSPSGLYANATFGFDPEDRLTSTSSPSFSAQYDGDGLRIRKATAYGTTYFLYDGASPSVPVVEETYSGSSATLSGLNGVGADGWRSHIASGTAYNFTYDPQGSLAQRQFVGNLNCRASDSSVFDAYGTLVGSLNANANPTTHRDTTGFGGQQGYYTDWDAGDTGGPGGLSRGPICLTHRYYDPGAGRFLTRDPIGYQGGANLYGFCEGNPVNEVDPNGTDGTSVLEKAEESVLEKAEEYVVHHTAPAVRRFGSFRVFRMSVRPSFFWNPVTLSAALFFASTKTVADDSTGPGSPYAINQAKQESERLEQAIQRNGGVSEGKDGYYKFPNRRAARQAASEIAGSLGSDPIVLRVRDYRGVPRNLANSNSVMGRETSATLPTGGSLAGWRDDFLGHDRFGAGPHVNAWRHGKMYHLHY